MRVHVAFTPAEVVESPTAIVVDVLRATSTIAQALAAGHDRVLCCSEVDEALAMRDGQGGGLLAGERHCVRIPGFDLGNSPREFLERRGDTVILTTTNGTRALVAAARRCELVLAGALVNVGTVAEAARTAGGDVVVVCAGVLGAFAMDDAYVAGRLVELIGGEPTDAAAAALRLRRTFPGHEDGLRASQSARNLVAASLEEDIAWCAQESVLSVVPRMRGSIGTAVEIAAA